MASILLVARVLLILGGVADGHEGQLVRREAIGGSSPIAWATVQPHVQDTSDVPQLDSFGAVLLDNNNTLSSASEKHDSGGAIPEKVFLETSINSSTPHHKHYPISVIPQKELDYQKATAAERGKMIARQHAARAAFKANLKKMVRLQKDFKAVLAAYNVYYYRETLRQQDKFKAKHLTAANKTTKSAYTELNKVEAKCAKKMAAARKRAKAASDDELFAKKKNRTTALHNTLLARKAVKAMHLKCSLAKRSAKARIAVAQSKKKGLLKKSMDKQDKANKKDLSLVKSERELLEHRWEKLSAEVCSTVTSETRCGANRCDFIKGKCSHIHCKHHKKQGKCEAAVFCKWFPIIATCATLIPRDQKVYKKHGGIFNTFPFRNWFLQSISDGKKSKKGKGKKLTPKQKMAAKKRKKRDALKRWRKTKYVKHKHINKDLKTAGVAVA